MNRGITDKADLLGSWTGLGTWHHTPSGTWLSVADEAQCLALEVLDGDGNDDIVGSWISQGGVWVKYFASGWAQLVSPVATTLAVGRMTNAMTRNLGTAQTMDAGPTCSADLPQIAIDGSGNAIAVFRQSNGTALRIYANGYY
jgi:hypothetical protein